MLYSFFDKVENVKWFDCNGEDIWINTINCVIDINSKNEIYKSHVNLMHLWFKNTAFFINNILGKGVCFIDSHKPQAIDGYIHFVIYPFIIYSKKENEVRNTFIEDVNSHHIVKLFGASTINFIKGSYFVRKNFEANIIEAFYFPTIENLWQYPLNELGTYTLNDGEVKKHTVEKFIGIWQNELLAGCSNGLIVSVDVKTGKEIRRWHELKGFYEFVAEFANKLPPTEGFKLLEQENKLITAWVYSYLEIDLLSGQVTHYFIKDELEKYGINTLKKMNDNPVTDTHIYLTASMPMKANHAGFTYDCLIALNRKTQKIDWQYKFEEEGLGTNVPKLSGDKLYQLTNSNNLYVFERVEE